MSTQLSTEQQTVVGADRLLPRLKSHVFIKQDGAKQRASARSSDMEGGGVQEEGHIEECMWCNESLVQAALELK